MNNSQEAQQITPAQIIAEIAPLIKEYFVAKYEIAENSIVMHFLNGESITLTAN